MFPFVPHGTNLKNSFIGYYGKNFSVIFKYIKHKQKPQLKLQGQNFIL